MFVVTHRTFFFWLTGLILAASVASIAFYGLPLSIDFTGGSLVEVTYNDTRPDLETLREDVEALSLGEVSVRESGENGVIVRSQALTQETHNALLNALSVEGQHAFTESRFTTIGPTIGGELKNKALVAILVVMLAIMLYIAWAFRKVSKPVPSIGYGIAVVAMLAIDIIVPAGFYAALCHFTGAQVDVLFVVALLALLGYCVNDVIIVFDRVREHLRLNEENGVSQPFDEAVGQAITETIGRSINTSLTVALALLALIFMGAEVTRNFALTLLVGVVVGTFSSICRSAPLLIPIATWFEKKEEDVSRGKKKKLSSTR